MLVKQTFGLEFTATHAGGRGPSADLTSGGTQRAFAAYRLLQDIARHAHEVELALAGAPTSQHEFDALVSFHYNTGAIARATLTRRHRAGQKAQAAAEFARWTRAGGRVLRGLVRRREAEARLYRGAAQ